MNTYRDLIRFLQESSDTKRLKFNTARTRKTAIRRLFENSKFEDTSIYDLNIDDVTSELINENNDISIGTINTYKSRFSSALKDYIRYEKLGETMPILDSPAQQIPKVDSTTKAEVINLPCPIRKGGHIINIDNLPVDLTEDELNRLTSLIKDFIEIK